MSIKVRTIVPDFYKKFLCKAGDCKHTCCQVWEIDVDADSAEYYFQQEGQLGAALKDNIVQNEEGYYIRLNKEGFCPFLQKDGLCHLIVALGEDSLCNICTEHPRFYEFFQGETEDIELGGVGLCCEATCELLLGNEEPLSFCVEGGATLDFTQLLHKIQVELPDNLIYTPRIDTAYLSFVLACMAQTEPIDEGWTQHIQQLQKMLPQLGEKLVRAVQELSQPVFTKLFHYVLYRQLEKSFNISTSVILAYGQLNMDYMLLASVVNGNLPETVRRWSEQIEYDDENVDLLLELAATEA